MKYLIASDIHGSLYYTELLLKRLEEEQADILVLLGDILYHGPRNDIPEKYDTKSVAARLNEYKDKIICVRGNCDAEVDQMLLEFPVLCDFGVIERDGRLLYLTHGHKFSIDNPPHVKKGSVVLSGHTHIPLSEEKDGVYFINPGSVSIPKGQSVNSFILFDSGVFSFRDLVSGKEYKTFKIDE